MASGHPHNYISTLVHCSFFYILYFYIFSRYVSDIKEVQGRVGYADNKFYTRIFTANSTSTEMSTQFCPRIDARRPLITTEYEKQALSKFGAIGNVWLDMDFSDGDWKTSGGVLVNSGLVPLLYQPAQTGLCSAYNLESKTIHALDSCDDNYKSVCETDGCTFIFLCVVLSLHFL